MNIPTIKAADLPALSRSQVQEVDRLMIEDFGIQLLQMMENAGLQLAELVRYKLGPHVQSRRIVILAGRGNNGGGGLAAARRLAVWGAQVSVELTDAPDRYGGVPALQLAILREMDVALTTFGGALPPHEMLVDALIGYGLREAPHGTASDMILAANESSAPVVSLDAPSGLDVDTGAAPGAAISAESTLTLALPKIGLLHPDARDSVGELYLADISVPAAIYERLGLPDARPFADAPLVRLLVDETTQT